jgi:hypothetical protein
MKNLSAIIGLSIPVIGLSIFFCCFELHILTTEIRRSIWFYSVSAGFSGLSYFAGTFKSEYKLLLNIISFYWAYLFIFYAIFDIFEPNAPYKWMYVQTGGILICLFLGLFFRRNSLI